MEKEIKIRCNKYHYSRTEDYTDRSMIHTTCNDGIKPWRDMFPGINPLLVSILDKTLLRIKYGSEKEYDKDDSNKPYTYNKVQATYYNSRYAEFIHEYGSQILHNFYIDRLEDRKQYSYVSESSVNLYVCDLGMLFLVGNGYNQGCINYMALNYNDKFYVIKKPVRAIKILNLFKRYTHRGQHMNVEYTKEALDSILSNEIKEQERMAKKGIIHSEFYNIN